MAISRRSVFECLSRIFYSSVMITLNGLYADMSSLSQLINLISMSFDYARHHNLDVTLRVSPESPKPVLLFDQTAVAIPVKSKKRIDYLKPLLP